MESLEFNDAHCICIFHGRVVGYLEGVFRDDVSSWLCDSFSILMAFVSTIILTLPCQTSFINFTIWISLQNDLPDPVVEPDPFSLFFFQELELEVHHKRQEQAQN